MKEYELLEAQARMMRMAEKYGVDDWRKLVRVVISGVSFNLAYHVTSLSMASEHRFALGVVEGKPVFVDDVMYCRDFSFWVKENRNGKLYGVDCKAHAVAEISPELCSWNPPAPKTVMVEIPHDFAEFYAEIMGNRMGEICRKALEAQSAK